MWNDLRILLLGEEKAGKTSLILSLISEEFPEDVPPRVEEITIPADVTPEKVPTHIIDFSFAEQSEIQLQEEIFRANVVCLIYDLSDGNSLIEVRDKWLNLIRDNSPPGRQIPVILVGSKSDLIGDSRMEEILPFMNDFPEIETFIECSSKTLKNISEVFYFAQKAVLHPTGPLYCTRTGKLKEGCKDALTCVFSLCDIDNDGVLNDFELSNFQKICFNTPLESQSLDDVKSVVKKGCPLGLKDGMITIEGFFHLNLLFIQRGRHETTWAVLRKFGYDDSLMLKEDYLCPAIPEIKENEVYQLNKECIQFLQEVFHKYDNDDDGVLNDNELSDYFAVFPYDPWGREMMTSVNTNNEGFLTEEGFLSQWMLVAYLEVPTVMEYLAYLGYSVLKNKKSQIDALEVVSINESKRFLSLKSTYACKVIGSRGAGKTAFLQGLLGVNIQSVAKKNMLSKFAVHALSFKPMTKYLYLHEVTASELLSAGDNAAIECDVICLIYDTNDPESFQTCISVYKKHIKSNVPFLIVASKSDMQSVQQHCVVQPEEFCKKNKLHPPMSFSCQDINEVIYETLLSFAVNPSSATTKYKYDWKFWMKFTFASGLLGLLGYGVYKQLTKRGIKATNI